MDYLPWRRSEQARPQVQLLLQTSSLIDIETTINDVVPADLPHDPVRLDPWQLAYSCQKLQFYFLKSLASEQKTYTPLNEFVASTFPPTVNLSGLRKLLTKLDVTTEQIEKLADELAASERFLLKSFQLIAEHEWSTDSFVIVWSIATFYETLRSHLTTSRESVHAADLAQAVQSHRLFINAFRGAGRCPTVLRRKSPTLLDAWTLLATPFQSPLFETQQSQLHLQCHHKECEAFHTSEDTYEPKHTPTCNAHQHCALRGIDVDILCHLLRKGSVPLVRSTVSSAASHVIDIVDGSKFNFTAISHVWAGGMGNFKHNEVYDCHLANLHSAASRSSVLRGTVYYWLDTLCIPVTDSKDEQVKQEYKRLRKQAINDMAYVYASASKVMVFDPLLQHTDAKSLSSRERATMIAASPWMARSWPLQEAALAVDIRFKFHDIVVNFTDIDMIDGPLDDSQLQSLWYRDVDRLEAEPWWAFAEIDNLLPQVRQNRKHREHRTAKAATASTEKLRLVWRELSNRNSKEMEDIALILAVFMGRSANEILNLKDQKHRMHALLKSQQRIPTSILFSSALQTPGQWTPQFPKCSGEMEDLPLSSFLEWINPSVLELSDPSISKEITSSMSQTVLPSYMAIMCDTHRNVHRTIKISFPVAPRELTHSEIAYMMLLPSTTLANAFEEKQRYISKEHTGVCLILKSVDDEKIYSTYCEQFHWTVPSNEEAGSLPMLPGATHDLQALAIDLNTNSRTFQIDLGIPPGPSLEWSRTDFYPFRDHSIHSAQALMLFRGLNIVLTSYLIVAFMTWTISLQATNEKEGVPWWQQILWWLLGTVALKATWIVCRQVLNIVERDALKTLLRRPLQDTWAYSFRTTNGTDANVDAQKYGLSPTLHNMHYPIACYSLLLLIVGGLSVPYFRYFHFAINTMWDVDEKDLANTGFGWLSPFFVLYGLCSSWKNDHFSATALVALSATFSSYVFFSLEVFVRLCWVAWFLATGSVTRYRRTHEERLDVNPSGASDLRSVTLYRAFYVVSFSACVVSWILGIAFVVTEIWKPFFLAGLTDGLGTIGWAFVTIMPTIFLVLLIGITIHCFLGAFILSDVELDRMVGTGDADTRVERQEDAVVSSRRHLDNAQTTTEEVEPDTRKPKAKKFVQGTAKVVGKVLKKTGKVGIELLITGIGRAWEKVDAFSREVIRTKARSRRRRVRELQGAQYLELVESTED